MVALSPMSVAILLCTIADQMHVNLETRPHREKVMKCESFFFYIKAVYTNEKEVG